MFEASRSFAPFDYFRVPYQVRSVDSGRWARLAKADEPGPALYWVPAVDTRSPEEFRLGATPLFAQLRIDVEPPGNLQWSTSLPLAAKDGSVVGAVSEAEDGSVFLPFDPGEAILNYWSEAYLDVGERSIRSFARSAARRLYYRLRPALPRKAQIALRRSYSRIQRRSSFPKWPVETALHDLYSFILTLAARISGEAVPWIAPWPRGCRWALVLTHDVETALGYRGISVLRRVEEAHEYRSSWNLVPERYEVEDRLVNDLHSAGFEVGVHGLRHDGRDLESLTTLEQRLPEIRRYAERWNASGFRSPATHRNWAWMPLLGFDYDSSYPDTDPFEPQAGGCCSWLPYTNQELVELPITLPQDHTLFVILDHGDETIWAEKADFLRRKGGMALLITHPDYLCENEGRVRAYERFLERYEHDSTAWRALPKDVSAWWRRRQASTIVHVDGEWQISGPAALDGEIAFTSSDAELSLSSGSQ